MVPLLYVFGLAAAFGAFWLLVAALQTFTDAAPARADNIIGTIACAAVSAGLFWLAGWYRRASEREASLAAGDVSDVSNAQMEDQHGVAAKG